MEQQKPINLRRNHTQIAVNLTAPEIEFCLDGCRTTYDDDHSLCLDHALTAWAVSGAL